MIPQLIDCFAQTIAFMQKSVADLNDEEIVLQPSGVRNHAAWTLGHVIFSCQAISGEVGVAPWLPEDWEARFGYGSTPVADASQYPDKAALLAGLGDASRRLQAALLSIDEAALAEPLPDEDAREILPTKGHALLQVLAGHTAYHAGQLAVWRQAIGRASVAVFI